MFLPALINFNGETKADKLKSLPFKSSNNLYAFLNNSYSETNSIEVDQIFHIGKMDSHNKEFVLFFKTREKAILAKGEEFNYITDYPQDLYIFDKITKKSKPLITYDWFPN